MNVGAYIFTLAYVALAGLLGTRLGMAIYRNIKSGVGFRQRLSEELAEFRIDRMLRKLGINRNAYLHEHRTHKIRQHISRCSACQNTAICDVELEQEELNMASLVKYCANANDLTELKHSSNEVWKKAA